MAIEEQMLNKVRQAAQAAKDKAVRTEQDARTARAVQTEIEDLVWKLESMIERPVQAEKAT